MTNCNSQFHITRSASAHFPRVPWILVRTKPGYRRDLISDIIAISIVDDIHANCMSGIGPELGVSFLPISLVISSVRSLLLLLSSHLFTAFFYLPQQPVSCSLNYGDNKGTEEQKCFTSFQQTYFFSDFTSSIIHYLRSHFLRKVSYSTANCCQIATQDAQTNSPLDSPSKFHLEITGYNVNLLVPSTSNPPSQSSNLINPSSSSNPH